MFKKIINYIDSLFYTTTITTTVRKTTTTFNQPFVPEVSDDGIRETSVTWEGDHFKVNDKLIPIPDVVKNRRPISDPTAFPHYADDPIIMEVVPLHGNGSEGSKQFVDGVVLSRTANYRGYNKLKVMREVGGALGSMKEDAEPSAVLSKVETDYLGTIRMYFGPRWILIHIHQHEVAGVCIYHKNPSLISSEGECVVAAYAYARCFLMTMSSLSPEYQEIEEDQLATTFLAMMLAHRV